MKAIQRERLSCFNPLQRGMVFLGTAHLRDINGKMISFQSASTRHGLSRSAAQDQSVQADSFQSASTRHGLSRMNAIRDNAIYYGKFQSASTRHGLSRQMVWIIKAFGLPPVSIRFNAAWSF